MPVVDGLPATKLIKAQKPDLPVIAITAYALSGDKEKSLEAGYDEYILKPIKKTGLLAIINKF
jgi:two-component system cell cycle response regulator DivK